VFIWEKSAVNLPIGIFMRVVCGTAAWHLGGLGDSGGVLVDSMKRKNSSFMLIVTSVSSNLRDSASRNLPCTSFGGWLIWHKETP